jgi:hypothetical protein
MSLSTRQHLSRRREFPFPGHQVWVREEADAIVALEGRYAQWLASLAEIEGMFKQHVYESEEPAETDFRQHRQFLYTHLAIGEELAVDFLTTEGAEAERARPYVELIDQKLDALRAVLHAWHGDLEAQNDLPDSFKQGLRDLAEGRTVEMESALRNPPAA